LQRAIVDNPRRTLSRIGYANNFLAVPVTVSADTHGIADLQDIHTPIGGFVIGVIAIQTGSLQDHFIRLLAEDIKSVTPVEIYAVADSVRLYARTFVTNVLRVISILRRRHYFVDVDERATFVDRAVPLSAFLYGHFCLRSFHKRGGFFPCHRNIQFLHFRLGVVSDKQQ